MKQKINQYIKTWESNCYKNGIPDSVYIRLEQLNKVPSYKAICKAILKNDSNLKTLGGSFEKTTLYSSLKRKELIERGVILQLRMDL